MGVLLMIDFDLGKYIDYVKNKLEVPIEDYYIEKDYLLSLFLSTWQNLKAEGKIKALDDLIFKGGTLLMRNYLEYPRISEDLDFTHKKCEKIRIMSQNTRINTIRRLIIPLLNDIKKVCNNCGFDFIPNRSDTKYVTAYHHKAVYSLSMYRISEITNLPIRIKAEINFVEHLQYPVVIETIKPIVPRDAVLNSLGYTIAPLQVPCYTLKEIILEKYRAILTRDVPMQRDIYDLYMIHKNKLDVFNICEREIFVKIKSGELATSHLKSNLSNSCKHILKKGFLDYEDDISLLSLSPIDNVEYEKFKKTLFKRLRYFCEKKNEI